MNFFFKFRRLDGKKSKILFNFYQFLISKLLDQTKTKIKIYEKIYETLTGVQVPTVISSMVLYGLIHFYDDFLI